MDNNIFTKSDFEVTVDNFTEYHNLITDYSNVVEWVYEKINVSKVLINSDEIENSDYAITGASTHYLDNMAKQSLQERAGILGSTVGELSNDDWQDVLNTCFPYKENNMLLYKVANKVIAAHSEHYAILPLFNLFDTAMKVISEVFSKATFLSGTLSHNLMIVDISLKEHQEIIDAYESALGFKLIAATPSIRIVSSNTGKSGANIYPTINFTTQSGSYSTIVGIPIKLEHKGDKATIERFKENIKMCYSMMIASVEKIESLAAVKINNPIECFCNIAQRLQLPKPITLQVAEEIQSLVGNSDSNGRFIYISMMRILERTKCVSETAKFQLADKISRCMTINMSSYDHKTCEWLSKQKINNAFRLAKTA